MPHPLGPLYRTHTCGDLRAGHVGQDVVLLGWAHRVRDLGSLVFIDLRDRYGLTQVVARDALADAAKQIRGEFVLAVHGRVEARAVETINARIPTGEIEVVATEVRVLSEAKPPAIPIADEATVTEDNRLKFRYLDLRRPRMQRNLALRHRAMLVVRNYFDSQGFLEIETPILTKSTPEGARDYLVPSRVHPGEFFALPQSPQILKQILMISGLDRYFQIVKCFRDEDLRADRQPEFTQIDVEMSFASRELVISVIEPLLREVFRVIGHEAALPFPQIPYAEAMHRYGSDKPDLRPGMPIEDLSEVFGQSAFAPFRDALAAGGAVRALCVPGAAKFSRRELDELAEQARQLGGSGIIWARAAPEGAVQSSALKALGEDLLRSVLRQVGAGPEDLLLIAAGDALATSKVLGQLRLGLAKKLGLLDPRDFRFLWVVDFPLLEWNEEEARFFAMHHPFTSPVDEDVALLETDPGKVRAKAYDVVLNGTELGGGSIRIHDQGLQSRMFRALGITDEEARARFGFFLDALQYGTPPHGGIALGVDRLVMLMAGEQSIREVMAFPKTAQAVDLMAGSPSPVDEKQLRELHLQIRR